MLLFWNDLYIMYKKSPYISIIILFSTVYNHLICFKVVMYA